MQANLNKYCIAYMGGRACFCENACLIQFVRDNRLCASCGVSVQGKETALFVNTPLDKYLYFCTPSCKDKFCNPPSSSAAVSTVPVATLSSTSGSSTTIVTPPQVIEILGDDDDVEIVAVTNVSDSKRTSRTDQPLNAANSAPMSALLNSTAKKNGCSVCGDHQVTPKYTFSCLGKIHYVCGEACLQAFKYANKVNLAPCPQCARVFVASGAGTLVTAKFEGETKLFCSNPCLERYRRQRQKNASCAWCGTKRTNADLVERVDANGKVQLFCTLKCLSLYRVNLQAMSNVSVPCDQCCRLGPAQYHLTMSDASVRNFCSYDCVISYQTQFNSESSSQPKPAAAAATGNLSPI
jgi:YHS domain-containing protein